MCLGIPLYNLEVLERRQANQNQRSRHLKQVKVCGKEGGVCGEGCVFCVCSHSISKSIFVESFTLLQAVLGQSHMQTLASLCTVYTYLYVRSPVCHVQSICLTYSDCSIQRLFYCCFYTLYMYVCVTVFLFAGASRPPPGFSTSHKEHLPMTDSVWGPAEQRPLGKPCCVSV